jgi:hypothetical protein
VTRRHATFTEANAWVHLAPERFTRHFPSIRSVWHAEGGRVWVDVKNPPGLDQCDFAWWEMAEQRTGEPVLPCGCWVQVRYRPHARETVCTFSNQSNAFHATLRISGRLMLVASALSRLHEALCVHPHDEATVQGQLEQALSEARSRRLARKRG